MFVVNGFLLTVCCLVFVVWYLVLGVLMLICSLNILKFQFDYRLPTTDYRLTTTDYRLPTTDY